MGDQRDGERQQEERGGGNERGRDALREELAGAVRAGVGEDGGEDADAERTAGVVGDVDQAACDAGVLGRDAGHAGSGQRAESQALAIPKTTVGSAMPVR
jgi:hypothetical protein